MRLSRFNPNTLASSKRKTDLTDSTFWDRLASAEVDACNTLDISKARLMPSNL
jgi:hypothetical protein